MLSFLVNVFDSGNVTTLTETLDLCKRHADTPTHRVPTYDLPQPQPPNAVLTASPTSGKAPLTVKFSGSGSSDPNSGGVITFYYFTFGDGSAPVQQSSPDITHAYKKKGTYTAWLIVNDNYGARSEAKSVTVNAK